MSIYRCVGYSKTFNFDEIKSPFKIKKSLSVVIPTYNEEGNMENVVSKVKEVLGKTEFKDSFEIVVVDDNSKDKTPEIIDRLAKKPGFIALHRKKRGIFTAVLDGIAVSNGKYVLTMDADLSHPPELIPKMLSYIDSHNMVIGSRYTKGGRMASSFTRRLGGFVLNRLCGILIGVPVKDLGGNFRLFKKSDFSKIKFKYPCSFAEFGHELFYRSQKLGFKVKEVPFTYKDRKAGVSKIGNLPLKQAMHYIKRALELRREK